MRNLKLGPVILFLLSLLIISIWFKDGKLLATGEDGLLLINPERAIEIYKYSWTEVGPGGASPGLNPLLPFFYLESQILNLSIPVWLFQASIFLTLLSIGSLSVYLLTKELLKNYLASNQLVKASFLAGLFYILNPISLLGVWYRFLHSFMFFYALAPLLFYLFIYGLNNRKNMFIILAPLISLLFTFAFAVPAFLLLLWVLPFLYSLSVWRATSSKDNFNLYPLIYFALTCGFWLIINLWWIFPYFELSKFAFGQEADIGHGINTLKANSQDFTLKNVVRLIHGGFLYRNEAFGSIYKNTFFIVVSYLVPLITIYGLIKFKGKTKSFFVISFILLIFLSKGTAPPLGEVFLWFFSNIPFLQAYRNPLEKVGILLPIVYAPLFSLGVLFFLNKIKRLAFKRFLFLIVIFTLMINTWPFFTGSVISYDQRDIRTEVPGSFTEARKIALPGNHIILSVPVMGGASGFYKWQSDFKGVESSEYLFNYPVITKFYDANSFFGQLLIGISNGKLVNNLTGFAQIFSADLVVLRKDTNVAAFGYNLDALERSERMIRESNLEIIFDSKEITLYKIPEEKVVPLIYTPQTIRMGESADELIKLLDSNQFDPKIETFICNDRKRCQPWMPPRQNLDIKSAPKNLNFKKNSAVDYQIEVLDSPGKFILVINNSYHPGWIIESKDQSNLNSSHIIANGYANGFIINKEGSFNLSLKFKPEENIQQYYKISFIAIVLGAGSVILRLIFHKRKVA